MSLGVTRNSIFSRKNVIWRLGGRDFRAKQFMTFFVGVKHKKDKKNLHIELAYF